MYYKSGNCRHLSRKKLDCAKFDITMAHTIFVYGTLLSEEIVKILLNRNPESHAGEASLRFGSTEFSFLE